MRPSTKRRLRTWSWQSWDWQRWSWVTGGASGAAILLLVVLDVLLPSKLGKLPPESIRMPVAPQISLRLDVGAPAPPHFAADVPAEGATIVWQAGEDVPGPVVAMAPAVEPAMGRPTDAAAQRHALRPALDEARIPPTPASPFSAPMMALVIDDLGHNPAAAERVMRLPGRATLAFLPYTDATPALAAAAAGAGLEVLVHLPMQPSGDADPGPNALLVDLSAGEIDARIDWAISRVPGAVGVNNHMGSLFTTDQERMQVVLRHLWNRHLFFVDSLTGPGSVGARVAESLGMPHSERDVFIDHVPTKRSIAAQLARAERLARRDGSVIAIGHPGEATLSALEAWLPGAISRGVVLTTLGNVISRRHCQLENGTQAHASCDPERYLAEALRTTN